MAPKAHRTVAPAIRAKARPERSRPINRATSGGFHFLFCCLRNKQHGQTE